MDPPDQPRDVPGRTRHRRRFQWRRKRAAIAPAATPTVLSPDGNVVIIQAGDFVSCAYNNCGTLRPLAEVADNRPCSGCGRV